MEPQHRPRPQHLEALDQANRVRRRRYAIRRRVKGRELSLTALFITDGLPAADAELIAGREVRELLEWGYRIGDTVSRRILRHAEIKATMPLEALSPSRREDLLELVRAVAPEACQGAERLEGAVLAALEAELATGTPDTLAA